jgi:transketolase
MEPVELNRRAGSPQVHESIDSGGSGSGHSNPADVIDLMSEHFEEWEIVKDLIDEMIDLSLNYRQSGHPGGSRSKVHMLVSLLLSGVMRWDLLRPWRPLQDRFVLSAGHTVPVVYSTLAVLNEAMRARKSLGGGSEFDFPEGGRWALCWQDLLLLRRRGGLPGHAEMQGKTLFLKYNTGPSGHGMAPAAGQALALKLASFDAVKVFCLEGEGGLTTGSAHETKNSAWALGLSNLVFLIDWNDFGIDPRAHSSVVSGSPRDWFEPHGWRVVGTEDGMSWGAVTGVLLDAVDGSTEDGVPTAAWFRTEKGRGYGKSGAASHGTPWPMNSAEFWQVRKRFADKYGVEYEGVDEAPPKERTQLERQAAHNLQVPLSLLYRDKAVTTYLSDRLLEISSSVPDRIEGFLGSVTPKEIFAEPQFSDPQRYPAGIWRKPGEMAANRSGLSAWGAYVNTLARAKCARPLFIACSADLAESTNVSGFASDFEGIPGWGWYDRKGNPHGTVLPQEITEFANAGLMAGMVTVNLAADPFEEFNGLWGVCSTYGAFTYLKYGALRLLSQLAQDCDLQVGKLLYVAAHSGPETAEDSRTHFGIYEPGIAQLVPEGRVINLHPWEYNEVPVTLAAALSLDVPIIVLHLARPAIRIPDRQDLGMDPHFAAARGAYIIRDYQNDKEQDGVVVVRGTVTTANTIDALQSLESRDLNVKIVAAISEELFARQDESWRNRVLSEKDRWDAMVITNGSLRFMSSWFSNPLAREYSLTPDWDSRWRTGGTVAEVMDEAHLSSSHVVAGIERFVEEKARRRGFGRQFVW